MQLVTLAKVNRRTDGVDITIRLAFAALRRESCVLMIASLEDLMRQSQSQAESLAHLQEVLDQELDGAKSPLAAPSDFAGLDTDADVATMEEGAGSITAPLPTPRSESKDNVSCGYADTPEKEEELKLLDRVADCCTFTEVVFVLVHASPPVRCEAGQRQQGGVWKVACGHEGRLDVERIDALISFLNLQRQKHTRSTERKNPAQVKKIKKYKEILTKEISAVGLGDGQRPSGNAGATCQTHRLLDNLQSEACHACRQRLLRSRLVRSDQAGTSFHESQSSSCLTPVKGSKQQRCSFVGSKIMSRSKLHARRPNSEDSVTASTPRAPSVALKVPTDSLQKEPLPSLCTSRLLSGLEAEHEGSRRVRLLQSRCKQNLQDRAGGRDDVGGDLTRCRSASSAESQALAKPGCKNFRFTEKEFKARRDMLAQRNPSLMPQLPPPNIGSQLANDACSSLRRLLNGPSDESVSRCGRYASHFCHDLTDTQAGGLATDGSDSCDACGSLVQQGVELERLVSAPAGYLQQMIKSPVRVVDSLEISAYAMAQVGEAGADAAGGGMVRAKTYAAVSSPLALGGELLSSVGKRMQDMGKSTLSLTPTSRNTPAPKLS